MMIFISKNLITSMCESDKQIRDTIKLKVSFRIMLLADLIVVVTGQSEINHVFLMSSAEG
jgi:hypothetical protein